MVFVVLLLGKALYGSCLQCANAISLLEIPPERVFALARYSRRDMAGIRLEIL